MYISRNDIFLLIYAKKTSFSTLLNFFFNGTSQSLFFTIFFWVLIFLFSCVWFHYYLLFYWLGPIFVLQTPYLTERLLAKQVTAQLIVLISRKFFVWNNIRFQVTFLAHCQLVVFYSDEFLVIFLAIPIVRFQSRMRAARSSPAWWD